MKLTETKEGTVIELFVKPNQPKFSVKVTVMRLLFSALKRQLKAE